MQITISIKHRKKIFLDHLFSACSSLRFGLQNLINSHHSYPPNSETITYLIYIKTYAA
jgi:hypothetical protein